MTSPRIYQSPPVAGSIYVLHQRRAGCRKLHCQRMPEKFPPNDPSGLGVPIELRAVPLFVRRAARAHIGLPATRRGM